MFSGAESFIKPENSLAQAERILVVDDDRTTLLYVSQLLCLAGYEVESFASGEMAWEWLQKVPQKPNLVLCDWTMPHLSGVDLCRRLKADPELNLIYFVLLSSKTQVHERVEGLDAGADEFIAKPLDPEELRARVRAGLRLQRLTQALDQSNRKLRSQNELLVSLSMTDGLTGLLNRRALDEALPYLLAQVGSRESGKLYRHLCLLIIDIDHFKQVNDQYGHAAGDGVLQCVAKRLQGQAPASSHLYRYGGEEFVCLMPGTKLSQGERYAEQMRSAISSHPIALPGRCLTLNLSISIGGVLARQDHAFDASTLVDLADQALYLAKSNGRNRIYWSCPDGSLQPLCSGSAIDKF